ncbi:hypothetical protein HMPREF1563_0399 [Providencia alcalifaciens 205/92]|uniref:Uncharacterized protein n=1 Tax=Providencia alcalifaciens 205/92 TaxID=1256988 RepID=A0AAV3M2P7_9GAMM|nr:hypothetical protein HMPREF1563_0399 [Providencia alcalifaciens 205/92]
MPEWYCLAVAHRNVLLATDGKVGGEIASLKLNKAVNCEENIRESL